jgi:hypothetical protein
MPTFIQRFTAFFSGLFSARAAEPDFAAKRRATEAKLAIRTHEFQEAKRSAALMRADYEQHLAAGDWSEEMLQIQLSNGKLELRKANLLFQQIKALQENLSTLSTAILGGEIVADAGVPVDESELEALDRAYFNAQRSRQGTVRAERNLAESLFAENAAGQTEPWTVGGKTDRQRTPESVSAIPIKE